MNLAVRNARADEVDIGLSKLKEASLWLKDKNIDYWQNWLNPHADHINWIKGGFENNEFYFVEDNTGIIGMYRLQYSDEMFWGKKDDRAGYIHSLTTSRNLSGKGIGAIILNLIERKLKSERIQFIRLDCGSEITGLCRYYEKNGFKKVDEREVFGFSASFYEKEIY